jgi:hypothetical protein
MSNSLKIKFNLISLINLIFLTNNQQLDLFDKKESEIKSFIPMISKNENFISLNYHETFDADLINNNTAKIVKNSNNLRSLEEKSPPNLDIYIDSLCPFSIKLLSGSFKDLYNNPDKDKLVKSINIYVYGKTKEQPDSSPYNRSFKCNHGVNECLTNRIENCALKILDKNEAFEFLICYNDYLKKDKQKNYLYEEYILKCAPFKYQEIVECTYNGLGYELMHEESLKDIVIYFTPYIVLDNQPDLEKSRIVVRDLVGYLCDYLELKDKIEGCNNKGQSGK